MTTDPRAERHVPVLLQRCVELLAPAAQHEGAVIVDGTLGLGGHSEALLRACPQARLIGLDRDPRELRYLAAMGLDAGRLDRILNANAREFYGISTAVSGGG